MPAIKIYDSLQASDIFFCIMYDFLQDQNSAGSLFKELMFCTQYALCFPACLFEICAKCVEGQCTNFFPGLLCVHEFFSLNFPLHEFFVSTSPAPHHPPPPHNFSNGPSQGTVANLDARDFLWVVSGFGHFFIVSGVPTSV